MQVRPAREGYFPLQGKREGKNKFPFAKGREGKREILTGALKCTSLEWHALLAALVGHTKLFYSTEEKNLFFVTNVKSHFQLETVLRLIEELY